MARTLIAASALVLGVFATSPPGIAWATGFSNGDCEAHPHAGVQTKDGGFLMVGDSQCYQSSESQLKRGIFVVKAGGSGQEQWSLRLGESGYNYGKFAVELRDGTFLVAGVKTVEDSNAKGGETESRYLARISSAGEIVRESVFPNVDPQAGTGDGFMCATETSEDGTVIATGWIRGDIGDPDQPMFIIWGTPFIMKLKLGTGSEEPSVIFDKVVQSSDSDDFVGVQGMRIYEDVHNGLYVMAVETHHRENTVEEMGLAALDANGDVKWFNFFPADRIQGTSMSQAYALTLAHDGTGYAVAGHGFKGTPWGRLIKVDPSGNLLWDKRFRNCDHESTSCDEVNTECYGVDATLDNGFIVTCGTGCTGQDCSSRDATWMAYVHRTDGDGNELWSKDYTSQDANNAGEYIVATREGGYAIYIDSNSWGSKSTGGNFGLMLLKSDLGTGEAQV